MEVLKVELQDINIVDSVSAEVETGIASIGVTKSYTDKQDLYIYEISKEYTNMQVAVYEHIQKIPKTQWEIEHNLNKFPRVTIIDEDGNVVEGDIKYIDMNHVLLEFTSKFSGKAYLS